MDLIRGNKVIWRKTFFIDLEEAEHASHAVCDFRKISNLECYTPSDNVSVLTARVNDDGWDTSYSNWLKAVSSPQMMDFLFSQ